MDDKNFGILAGIDGSPLMYAVCDYAAWISQKSEIPVTLLHTLNHHQEVAVTASLSGSIGLGSQEDLLEELIVLEQKQNSLKKEHGKLLLNASLARLNEKGIKNADTLQRHGELSETLTEIENQIDLVVLGKFGKEHAEQEGKIGGKLEVILRSMHKPTLIVPCQFSDPSNLMIACDGTHTAKKAIEFLSSSSLTDQLTCHIVCVNKDQGTMEETQKIAESAGFRQLICSSLQGDVANALESYQEQNDIDLTVMGAYSHNRLVGMILGSFTTKMLQNSKKPLLLVR